jgi:hypothetical protein
VDGCNDLKKATMTWIGDRSFLGSRQGEPPAIITTMDYWIYNTPNLTLCQEKEKVIIDTPWKAFEVGWFLVPCVWHFLRREAETSGSRGINNHHLLQFQQGDVMAIWGSIGYLPQFLFQSCIFLSRLLWLQRGAKLV